MPAKTNSNQVGKFRTLINRKLLSLNVFAHVLYLEKGKLDSLLLGINDDEQCGLYAAQKNVIDHVASLLSKPQSKLMMMGIDYELAQHLLLERGHIVATSQFDVKMLDILKNYQEVEQVTPSTIVEGHNDIDTMISLEYLRFHDPTALFNSANAALRVDGELVVLDKVALQTEATNKRGLYYLDHLIALGERNGYELVDKKNLSGKAETVSGHLVQLAKENHSQIMKDLNLSKQDFEIAIKNLENEYEDIREGAQGYVILHFNKKKIRRWHIGVAEKADRPALFRLFRKVFGEDISSEVWEWKYDHAKGISVIARNENEIIAHYGGAVRKVSCLGDIQSFWQVSDVMVLKSERGTFTRKGPFFLTAATFIELFATPFNGRSFGFPSRRHANLGKKLGLYTPVDEVVEVRWSPLFKSRPLGVIIRPISLNKDRSLVDTLWESMRKDLNGSFVGVRDMEYIEHRYFHHPEKKYSVMAIQDFFGMKTIGILVFNQQGEECELLDVIAPVKCIPKLLNTARIYTKEIGANSLFCWITEHNTGLFRGEEGKVVKLGITVPIFNWVNRPDLEKIRGRWWLMSGDTDFH